MFSATMCNNQLTNSKKHNPSSDTNTSRQRAFPYFMEPYSKVPVTADQSSLNVLPKLLFGCFLLLKVIANTLQVNNVTVNGRMGTVVCHHDITVDNRQ